MKKQYSAEFKLETVKRIERTGESVSNVSSDLGVKPTTIHGWLKNYKKSSTIPYLEEIRSF